MKIKLVSVDGWDKAYFVARNCIGKTDDNTELIEPPLEWKQRLLLSNHSPIRQVMLLFWVEIPNKTQNHIVRHKTADFYVSTLRSDLTGAKDTDITRLTTRQVAISCNLESFISMCKKRLCRKSELETQKLFEKMVDAFIDAEPDLVGKEFFKPNCLACKELAFGNCLDQRHRPESLKTALFLGVEK